VKIYSATALFLFTSSMELNDFRSFKTSENNLLKPAASKTEKRPLRRFSVTY